MAEVYKAMHPTLHRPVAIKVLPHSLAQDSEFRKRFEREARTVAALKHPNIVQMFDFGEADGTAFMVIEYIGGPDVSDTLKGGALPLDRALPIAHDVAGALDYAHQQGLVHRDIKPSNVMLDSVTTTGSDGRVERAVLMDFGIARILGGNTRLTASGMIGTLDYMSPEQIKDSKEVDGRADIYSLGVMLFQMLTGRLPFTASNPGALLIAHLNQPAPNPRDLRADIPDEVAEATLRALEKDPARRFQTAGEFAAALA
jgi:serine/threonine protein kinase